MLALIVLASVAGLIAANRAKTAGGPVAPAPGASSSSSASAPSTSKPSDAVKAYLEALAAGQAGTALALGMEQPADTTFLTDAVLAESNKRAPITGITVPEVTDEYAYSVDSTYKMGTQLVSDKYNVQKVGDAWKVRTTFAEMNVKYQRNKTLPMLVNGVPVKTDSIRVFPGSYAFTTGLPNIDYGTENVVLVKNPSDYAALSHVDPTLTAKGEAAFIKAAKAKIGDCLKQKKMAPAGCPFSIRQLSGQKVDESTIVWKMVESPFDNIKLTLDYENPAVVKASPSMYVSATAKGTDNGRRTTFRASRILAFPYMSANMTQEPIVVKLTR